MAHIVVWTLHLLPLRQCKAVSSAAARLVVTLVTSGLLKV